jgi:hypothetical protein
MFFYSHVPKIKYIGFVGQEYCKDSARAALLMSLESVFAALICYMFLDEVLTGTEFVGAIILIFSTTLVTFQVNDEEEEEGEEEKIDKKQAEENRINDNYEMKNI